MGKHSAEKVAEALLLLVPPREDCMHYDELDREIRQSKLTDLGKEGITPDRTVNSILSQNEKGFFKAIGGGYYALSDPPATQQDSRIQAILNDLAIIDVVAIRDEVHQGGNEHVMETHFNRLKAIARVLLSPPKPAR